MPKYVASYEGNDALNSFLINEASELSSTRQLLTPNFAAEVTRSLTWRNPISREIVNHLLRRVLEQPLAIYASSNDNRNESEEDRTENSDSRFNFE
jgi:hypothetical protein